MAATARGLDPAKPLILLIVIGTCVTAGFAIKHFRDYRTWDDRLRIDLQNWRGYDPSLDATKRQRNAVSVRERMNTIIQQVDKLPKDVRKGVDQQYQNVGSFLDNCAYTNGLEKPQNMAERADSRGGVEEKRFSFELSRFERPQLIAFLHSVETQRPVLKVLEITSMKQSDPKTDDWTHWDCKVVVAYRRALE